MRTASERGTRTIARWKVVKPISRWKMVKPLPAGEGLE